MQLTDLMGIIVHGDPAALAQREVDVGDRPIRHLWLLAPAAAQAPRPPQRVLADGLVLHCDVDLPLQGVSTRHNVRQGCVALHMASQSLIACLMPALCCTVL